MHVATRVPREDEYSAVTLPPPDPKFRPSIVRAVPPLVGRVNEGLEDNTSAAAYDVVKLEEGPTTPAKVALQEYPLPYPATVVHCNWTCGVDTTQEAVKVRPVGLAYVTATGGEPTPKFAPDSVTRVPPSVANVIAGIWAVNEGAVYDD